MSTNPSSDYIDFICSLYNSSYDDRIENTAPPTAGGEDRTPGEDWMPGVPANHKSLISFQRELAEQGIRLSTSKIKKILVTGGLWTTQQTRTIQEMFGHYTGSLENDGKGLDPAAAIKRIADELKISTVSVKFHSLIWMWSTTCRSHRQMQRDAEDGRRGKPQSNAMNPQKWCVSRKRIGPCGCGKR